MFYITVTMGEMGEWELCFNPFCWSFSYFELSSATSTVDGFYRSVGPFSIEKRPGV